MDPTSVFSTDFKCLSNTVEEISRKTQFKKQAKQTF